MRAGRDEDGAGGRRRAWSVESVQRLGLTTDLDTAAAILGIGRTLAYELSKAGTFPVRLLRMGRRVVVPVPELLRLLGAEGDRGDAGDRGDPGGGAARLGERES